MTEGWNPAQRAVVELLGKGADRQLVPDDLADELRAELEDAVAPLVPLLDPADRLYASKHDLSTIFSCEAQFVAGQGQFEWSPPVARGIVAHKAIELMLNVRIEPHPATLVDEAVARLTESDTSVAAYLGGLGEYDLAELRSLAVNHVARFAECFPPLKASWVPRTESKIAVELAGGLVRLGGKVDLTLGRPPDKVIIDLKSGWPNPNHREDLRFYALVELLSLGVAPRKVANYYLDQAEAQAEDVTEAALRSAARRTADGLERIVSVTRAGEVPTRTPGPFCRWCPLRDDCEPGRVYLARREADDV
jgi:CRISPR/Cas system-associated exonuclease Cas4 (RecB family)